MKLTISEAANKYSVTPLTIRNWIKDGVPFDVEKVIGIRPRMKVDTDEIEKYLKSKETKR